MATLALARISPQHNSSQVPRLIRQEMGVATWEHLFAACDHRIYGLCIRITKDETAVKDLVQETRYKIWRNANDFRGESAFTTWMSRIAVNECLMYLRKSKPIVSLEEEIELEENGVVRQHIERDRFLEGAVERSVIQEAIEKLPPGYRIVFILQAIDGYNAAEIAEIFGSSVGNIKSQYWRARARLRELLTEAGFSRVYRKRSRKNRSRQ